jgi:methyltransferase (TIGR00027 family)
MAERGLSQRPASRTAEGVALSRALHHAFDAPPRVLEDPIAPLFFSPAQLEAARAEDSPGTRMLRSHVVLRSRWAEECAASAVERGAGAVVVLGAGWDTFSVRRHGLPACIPVIEVDHPASQAEKVGRLAAAGVAVPAATRFVGVDFAKSSLEEGLQGVIPSSCPIVFVCLGVIMYLAEGDIASLFSFVAKQPAGSELIVSFAPNSPRFGAQVAFHGASLLAAPAAAPQPTAEAPPPLPALGAQAQAAAAGEPWLSLHSPEGIEAQLRAAGFSEVRALSLAKGAEFFGPLPRADSLLPPARVSVVSARV